MVILDAQIVILGLPSIEDDLDFSAGGSQWVLSAYLLSFGGLLLLGGRSADLLGRRRMFMIGTGLFLVASLLCGLAWSGGVLIGARVLQGVSAAIMAPTALSILMTTFEEGPERNKALGIWSAIGGVGATAALLIGGPLTDGLGWEWIFFINIPVAIGLLGLSPILVRESRGRSIGSRVRRRRGRDSHGGARATRLRGRRGARGWLGRRPDDRTSDRLRGPAGALCTHRDALGLAAGAAPHLQLADAGRRQPRAGRARHGRVGMSVTVSLYAQRVLGYSALEFGLGTAVMTVGAVGGSTVGQAIVTRIGFRPVAAVGLALTGAGCLLLTQVSVDGSYLGDIFFGLLIFGPGLGATFVAASVATLAGVAEQESGLASALNNAAFQIGGALGAAVVTTVAISASDGPDPLSALTEGFQSAFAAAAVFSALGVLFAILLLGSPRRPARLESEPVGASAE